MILNRVQKAYSYTQLTNLTEFKAKDWKWSKNGKFIDTKPHLMLSMCLYVNYLIGIPVSDVSAY